MRSVFGFVLVLSACGEAPPVAEVDIFGRCSDGIDNDRNGAIDCVDQGCSATAACMGDASVTDSAVVDQGVVDSGTDATPLDATPIDTSLTDVTDAPAVPARRVFVTSRSLSGDILVETGQPNAASAADWVCGLLAEGAALSGVWRALIQTPDRTLLDVAPAGARYSNLDGVVLFRGLGVLGEAIGWASITDEARRRISQPAIDDGGVQPGVPVWTGFTTFGAPAPETCATWSDVAGSGRVGDALDGVNWLADYNLPCENRARLYCVEQ